MDESKSPFQPTPRQIRTGRICSLCQFREPPPNRSVCLTCLPATDQAETQGEAQCVPNGFGLCSTHPVCDYMRATVKEYQGEVAKLKAQWVKETRTLHKLTETQGGRIRTLEKALRYAADCSTVEMVRDTVRGMGVDNLEGWRQQLRDFAEDREQHAITREHWECDRHHGITLYSSADFFTAYFDDAAEMWNQADDTLPMFHVMVQSDPPHRACIHAIHLAAWAQHLAGICMPLQIMAMDAE